MKTDMKSKMSIFLLFMSDLQSLYLFTFHVKAAVYVFVYFICVSKESIKWNSVRKVPAHVINQIEFKYEFARQGG